MCTSESIYNCYEFHTKNKDSSSKREWDCFTKGGVAGRESLMKKLKFYKKCQRNVFMRISQKTVLFHIF